MRITIVGGGNIGTQFAVHCAEKGHEVIVYTSTPEVFDRRLSIVDDRGQMTHEGVIKLATYDPEEAFYCAQLIIVTVPAMMMEAIADMIYKYASRNAIIGVVPGNGGSECAFRKCIEHGNVFFGIERVPAIARLVQKGHCVKSANYRDELHVAAFPQKTTLMCAQIVSGIFDMKTTIIPNFMNLTMTPSNPILHTTRLYSLFSDWHDGIVYQSIPLFYENWDDKSSELLIACDDEVQSICHALPEFELQYVKSLKEHYESYTVNAMTKKISSIPSFQGIKTPAIKVEGGYIPDLHSRYFTADFSYGLAIIKQIAEFADVRIPMIDKVFNWYDQIAIEKHAFQYKDYDIKNLSELHSFYLM